MIPHYIEQSKVATLKSLPTPSFVIDEGRLINNLQLLNDIEHRSGCKILLAQKCFSTFSLYPLIGKYISGTTASGIFEARLGKEEMGKENHVFAPAFKSQDISELDDICDHIVFNSWNQYRLHSPHCRKASLGIRVNPQFSTQDHAIYDPCTTGSRLGVTIDQMPEALPENIEGLHFHTLCEQGFEDLEKTFNAFELKFGKYLPSLKWLNLGGGHYIAHQDYNVEGLINFLNRVRDKYNLQLYLEPGEGVVLNAGYMVTEVMDKVKNGMEILILDFSAACHCPDIIEMPLLPPIFEAEDNSNGKYPYRLSSMTCLAGDVIGDYSFSNEINIGDKIIIEDMALYTMVKTNTFNGMSLPDIFILKSDGSTELIKRFGYKDFKERLG
ncbi:MAG: carboxynorspermidine decarboxylase [Bacteroidales bacterium]|nr:carboxynorspermidine decarboxylase [Bacteroidales bacterium]